MSEVNATVTNNQLPTISTELRNLFAQLHPEEVETFYQSYQLWTIEGKIAAKQAQIDELQQKIAQNARRMQSVEPSPIALSVLAQLQAYDVSNLELLDRMLERGESWLDHTLQLLARCEQLDVIRGDYTQWCENALEGAYDWIDSMDEAENVTESSEPFDENIEAAFLLKLMSEEDTLPEIATSQDDTTHEINLDQAPRADNLAQNAAPSINESTDDIALVQNSPQEPLSVVDTPVVDEPTDDAVLVQEPAQEHSDKPTDNASPTQESLSVVDESKHAAFSSTHTNHIESEIESEEQLPTYSGETTGAITGALQDHSQEQENAPSMELPNITSTSDNAATAPPDELVAEHSELQDTAQVATDSELQDTTQVTADRENAEQIAPGEEHENAIAEPLLLNSPQETPTEAATLVDTEVTATELTPLEETTGELTTSEISAATTTLAQSAVTTTDVTSLKDVISEPAASEISINMATPAETDIPTAVTIPLEETTSTPPTPEASTDSIAPVDTDTPATDVTPLEDAASMPAISANSADTATNVDTAMPPANNIPPTESTSVLLTPEHSSAQVPEDAAEEIADEPAATEKLHPLSIATPEQGTHNAPLDEEVAAVEGSEIAADETKHASYSEDETVTIPRITPLHIAADSAIGSTEEHIERRAIAADNSSTPPPRDNRDLPAVTKAREQAEQTLQNATASTKPTLSWHDPLPPPPASKPRGLLKRLQLKRRKR